MKKFIYAVSFHADLQPSVQINKKNKDLHSYTLI